MLASDSATADRNYLRGSPAPGTLHRKWTQGGGPVRIIIEEVIDEFVDPPGGHVVDLDVTHELPSNSSVSPCDLGPHFLRREL